MREQPSDAVVLHHPGAAVPGTRHDFVRLGFTGNGSSLPLMIEPGDGPVELVAWAANNRARIDEELIRHGAILFRGFEVAEGGFEPFIGASSNGALPYTERSSPRTQVKGNVYTSTDYPPRLPIFPHNEQSYNRVFPRKIYFMCITPSLTLGATPLCDCRKVLRRLDPAIVRAFAKRKYMYVRNFGGGMGLDWQDAFQTSDRAEVEAYCSANAIAFEWRGEDELRTRQVRETIARHPDSGEAVWFNHLTFFHVSTLPEALRDALLSSCDEADLPNNTYYGDGSRIEDSVMDALRGAYESELVSFPWQKHDVLLVDNMLASHARQPYTGPRRVLAGMADPWEWTQVAIPAGEVDQVLQGAA